MYAHTKKRVRYFLIPIFIVLASGALISVFFFNFELRFIFAFPTNWIFYSREIDANYFANSTEFFFWNCI